VTEKKNYIPSCSHLPIDKRRWIIIGEDGSSYYILHIFFGHETNFWHFRSHLSEIETNFLEHVFATMLVDEVNHHTTVKVFFVTDMMEILSRRSLFLLVHCYKICNGLTVIRIENSSSPHRK
jgi:hypothetical protein